MVRLLPPRRGRLFPPSPLSSARPQVFLNFVPISVDTDAVGRHTVSHFFASLHIAFILLEYSVALSRNVQSGVKILFVESALIATSCLRSDITN